MAKRDFLSILSLLIIFAFSFVFIVYTLSFQSIRLDEAQSLWMASKSVPTYLNLTAKDVHVPLYNTLLHFWIQIFGINVTTARIMSLIFYLLTIPVLFLMCIEASGKKAAVLTTALFSLSPFVAWYSFEARMYTLFTFVTVLNHLYFLRLIRSDGNQGNLGYFISTVLGFYTHYFFVFLVFSQFIFAFLYWVNKCEIKSYKELIPLSKVLNQKKKPVVKVFLLITGAFLVFTPWLAYMISEGMASTTKPQIPPPTTFNIFQTFVTFLFGFQSPNIQAFFISLWPLFVIVLFFIFTKKTKEIDENLVYFLTVTFLPVILVFAISYFKPIFLSRYLIFITPTLFFCVAYLVLNYPRQLATYLAGGMVVAMFIMLVFQNTSYATPVKENYEPLAEYLSGQVSGRDIIAISAPFTIYPIEYSYSGAAKIETIPLWDRFAEGGIPSFNPDDLVNQVKIYQLQYDRIFIVLSYDQGYEQEIRAYFDENYRLNSYTKFSPGLELREYQLRYY